MASHDEQGDGSSLLTDSLRAVTKAVSKRPRTVLWGVALTVVACVVLTVQYMDFKTDRADLIDPHAEFHQRWLNYTERFGDSSDVVIAVEGNSPEAIEAAIDDVGTRLRAEPKLFTSVLDKVEPGRIREKALQYLSPEQLETGLKRLDQYGPVLAGRWELVDLDSLITRFDYQLRRRSADGRQSTRSVLVHSDKLLSSMHDFRSNPRGFESPWPTFLDVDDRLVDHRQRPIYFLNEDGTMGFVKVVPGDPEDDFVGATEAIDRLRTIIAEVGEEHEGTRLGLTGIPVLENDEMRRSQTDMMFASGISFVGVGLLLFLGFRGFRHPMLAMAMLAVGMAWAFGYTTIAIGHLNILSVSFAVILIGLGIDFAIHYLARYLELRHDGEELKPALEETSSGVGTGIITAAITTALAFFCATFTDFLGVAELGIIAGGGILLCAAATFLVLPALISIADKNVEPKGLPTPFEANGLRAATSRYPLLVLILSVGIVGFVGAQSFGLEGGEIYSKVDYDANLLNLQAKGLESVEVQERIIEKANASVLYGVSLADSPQEARRLRAEFEKLPSVARVEELATRLPNHPSKETRLLLQAYRARLASLPGDPFHPERVDPSTVGIALERFHASLRRLDDPYADRIARTIDEVLNDLERMPLADQVRFLGMYESRCKSALLAQFHTIRQAANPDPVLPADLPPELTSRFVADGQWLLQIYPKENVWDRDPLARFVADVRSVDPEVTGTPLQNYEASAQIRSSYERAALFALAVVALVLLVDFLGNEYKMLVLFPSLAVVGIVAMTMQTRRADPDPLYITTAYVCLASAIAAVVDFRNLRDAILAMLPAVCGGILMFGMLGLLGVDLNPANLIVLPLVLGIGVDDGVHVVHDFRMQDDGDYRTSSSTINAVMLTSLTSMIGFGSMMVAAHRGLYSVGLVLVIGVGSCLFVALVMLPAILTMLGGAEYEAESDSQSNDGNGEQGGGHGQRLSKRQQRRMRDAA